MTEASDPIDPVALTQALVRCPSVTPEEGGALVLLEEVLSGAGFHCRRVDRGGVANLFARWGPKGHPRTFGFNGHVDVVPVGDRAAWTSDPFGGEIRDGWLHGRGATDMKSGVAAFAAAAAAFLRETPPDGAVVLAITGDEEGPAVDGTAAILDWMEREGERMAACLVGEPTSPAEMGEMIKIGRRGSISAWLTVEGVQGHAAYPHLANNPVHAAARLAARLAAHELDRGTAHFDPSTLQVVAIETGNAATNVIPAACRAVVNVRFNDRHSGASLEAWLREEADRTEKEDGVRVGLRVQATGEAFLTPPGPLSDLVAGAVAAETNRLPLLSTTGGTSDARFVRRHCPVVECGLVGHRMHGVDERCRVEWIEGLARIYGRVLRDWFAPTGTAARG